MFSRLIKRGAKSETTGDVSDGSGRPHIDDDALLMNEANPERLLEPEKKPAESDMSWLDSAPALKEPAAPVAPSAPPKKAEAATPEAPLSPAPRSEPKPATRPAPNAAAGARPSHPYGWLVVVEGPETGSWHVLERGLSQIGSAEGQTVKLAGDVAPERHAELYYDETRHAFVLYGGKHVPVRLNGIEIREPSILRDGDVIALGGTALRLVALCSQNFSWAAERG